VNGDQAAAVGEYRFDLHHRDQVCDAIHDVFLGQRRARILRDFFDGFARTGTVKGNRRVDCHSFGLVEFQDFIFSLQSNFGHHVDEQLVELSRS
jgi:hypothetical protein